MRNELNDALAETPYVAPSVDEIASECADFAMGSYDPDVDKDFVYLTPSEMWEGWHEHVAICEGAPEEFPPMPAEFPHLYLAEVWKREPEIFRAIVKAKGEK